MLTDSNAELTFKSLKVFEIDFYKYQDLRQYDFYFLAVEIIPEIVLLMETQHIDYFRLPAVSCKIRKDVKFYFKKLDTDLYDYLYCEVLQ
ncbi:DUF5960 family protein [Enterococcus sp. AZ109]|uniref:DUF5960 family protein n=1 Tax=Enterococcus sp. AZ109 TaxID=2774634 RepID=UPI003F1F38EF